MVADNVLILLLVVLLFVMMQLWLLLLHGDMSHGVWILHVERMDGLCVKQRASDGIRRGGVPRIMNLWGHGRCGGGRVVMMLRETTSTTMHVLVKEMVVMRGSVGIDLRDSIVDGCQVAFGGAAGRRGRYASRRRKVKVAVRSRQAGSALQGNDSGLWHV